MRKRACSKRENGPIAEVPGGQARPEGGGARAVAAHRAEAGDRDRSGGGAPVAPGLMAHGFRGRCAGVAGGPVARSPAPSQALGEPERQGADGVEDVVVDLALGDRDRELALDRHHELERVDRIEAQPSPKSSWSSPIDSGSSPSSRSVATMSRLRRGASSRCREPSGLGSSRSPAAPRSGSPRRRRGGRAPGEPESPLQRDEKEEDPDQSARPEPRRQLPASTVTTARKIIGGGSGGKKRSRNSGCRSRRRSGGRSRSASPAGARSAAKARAEKSPRARRDRAPPPPRCRTPWRSRRRSRRPGRGTSRRRRRGSSVSGVGRGAVGEVLFDPHRPFAAGVAHQVGDHRRVGECRLRASLGRAVRRSM